MATFNIVMPKLGESVLEATITKWFKGVGDSVEEDDALLEIATDKVDSEIPSPVDGVITKILFEEDALVPVGEVIAVIDLDGEGAVVEEETSEKEEIKKEETLKTKESISKEDGDTYSQSQNFYSPLVKSIAAKEGLSVAELDGIEGTGQNGRVKKGDVLKYLETRQQPKTSIVPEQIKETNTTSQSNVQSPSLSLEEGDTVIKMDRMRKMIADHMVMSKQVSPHVTNFIEVDVTEMVLWREKIKVDFQKREGQKITYTPVFIEAIAKSLKEYPGINASVDGDNIILRKNINIGVAVALPTGNLIVPVVKNADQKSLIGLTVDVNKLANQARNNKLQPDDIAGGTFTVSNFGSFRNLTGTPIINQPQVAILATGNIEKKPAVLETPSGDVIAIRHKMILALTYDHRVIDGALAGNFLRYLADILEEFDVNRNF